MWRRASAFWLALLELVSCGDGREETGSLMEGPELIQPGVISTDLHETFPAIDPVDGSLWFSLYDTSFAQQRIMRAPRNRDVWGPPGVAPFSGTWSDRAPRFTPDGSRLYFTSNRPQNGNAADSVTGDLNIWVATRLPDGGWSDPVIADPPLNTNGADDMHVSFARDGTMYFASDRAAHSWDIYRLQHARGTAEPLRGFLSDSLIETDVLAGPDGNWLVLVVTRSPEGPGDDLVIANWNGGAWSSARNIGPPTNSRDYEYGPSLSPDGRWLYFTSHRRGSADVYRVPVSALVVHE